MMVELQACSSGSLTKVCREMDDCLLEPHVADSGKSASDTCVYLRSAEGTGASKDVNVFHHGLSQMFSAGHIPFQLRNVLASTRAMSFAFVMEISEVHLNWTIEDVLQTLETKSFVLVRKFGSNRERDRFDQTDNDASEVILGRMALLQAAMRSKSLQMPLSSILEDVRVVESVRGNETLDKVFTMMIASGHEEISVTDQGVVRGVITAKCLLAFIRHHKHLANGNLGMLARISSFGAGLDSLKRKNSCKELGIGKELALDNDGDLKRFPVLQEDSDEVEIKTKEENREHRCVRDYFTEHQHAAQTFCTSWCCELLIAICVILDVCIGIVDLVTGSKLGSESKSLVLMCCVLSVFLYERTLRTYGFWLELLYHPFWVFECVIVDVSVLVAILVLCNVLASESRTTVTMVRVLRMLRICLIIRNFNVTRKLRHAVSSQKARYREDGFDLDLTYINDQCIAMSLPAIGTESHYRNPVSEVQRFFATKHRAHFLIFNLCRERDYEADLFDGRVVKIDVEDHNPPLLGQIIMFLERAGQFMEEDELNCIAVHCKGGKGRTGVMICAWLMYSKFLDGAGDAMQYFADVRTGKKARKVQGVSQPSQQRYVMYVEEVLKCGGYYTPTIVLKKIVMKTCPRVDSDGGCNPWITIEENGRVVFDYRQHQGTYIQMRKGDDAMPFDIQLRLQGDIRVTVFDHDDAYNANELCGLRKRSYAEADDLCCFFWFHTGFISEGTVVLDKQSVDIACHDHTCKVFQPNFAVELHFEGIPLPGCRDRGPFRKLIKPGDALVQRSKAMMLLDRPRRARISRASVTLNSPSGSAVFQRQQQQQHQHQQHQQQPTPQLGPQEPVHTV